MHRARSLSALSMLSVAASAAGQGELLDGFVASPWFDEQWRVIEPAEGVRALLNAPRALKGDAPLRVVVYATPNGNTIEQTLGCAAGPGVDWRYDIQHVAAQVRRLRELATDEQIVLACVEADGLSWPAWRKRHGGGGAGLRDAIDRILGALPADDARIELCAHSGGGSLVFGFLEDGDEIPDRVERIVLLDANYGYARERGHGEKLLAWLRRSPSHRLVVLAYDDREVEYQGRRIVGPDGGTFRATGRMLDELGAALELERSVEAHVERTTALDGRLVVLRHLNPERRILHTALVGDMNGLLFALSVGSPRAATAGGFGAPRRYERWIQPRPGTGIDAGDSATPTLGLPPRRGSAPAGSAVLRRLADLPLAEREARILAEIERGNVPSFLRRLVPVEVVLAGNDGSAHRLRLHVTADYLAVGSDRDSVRVPLTPASAQRAADLLGMALPTRRIVTQIHAQAAVQLEPQPRGEPRQAVAAFLEHDATIDRQLAGRAPGLLVAGHKKDLVVTPRLATAAGKVAIFGWHRPDGSAIQPLYTGHAAGYVDYSHGVRLVAPELEVDGRRLALAELLTDPELHPLVSDEGPVPADCQRYR